LEIQDPAATAGRSASARCATGRPNGTFGALSCWSVMERPDEVATLPELPAEEAQRLAEKFNVSLDEVRLAAKRAGSQPAAIEAELRRQATS
jgi:hypothetical protein